MKNIVFLDSVKQMPLLELPVRTVVVTLSSGTVIISPGSNLTKEQYADLKNVTDIVAPNLFHNAGIKNAAQVFPHAKVWRARNINVDSWPHSTELPLITLKGMPKVQETLFVHKPSKSLILTDLCFNLVNPKGFGAWLILNMFGTYKKFGVSRFFTRLIQDKDAFEKSLGELFTHDFENIIVSHGENIHGIGKAMLMDALKQRGLSPR